MAEPSAGGLKLPQVDLLRALQNPTVSGTLIVDLIPLYMVLAHGWQAALLVLLYWIENLVIGVFTLLRMIGSAFGRGPAGAIVLLLGPFFTFHYGMCCAAHGTFVWRLVGSTLEPPTPGVVGGSQLDIFAMVRAAFALQPELGTVVLIGIVWRAVVLVWHFVLRGDWRDTDPVKEMNAPYGRIVVLHIGIFAGFLALLALGQPLWGVLGLIVARSLWGIVVSAREAEPPKLAPAQVPTSP